MASQIENGPPALISSEVPEVILSTVFESTAQPTQTTLTTARTTRSSSTTSSATLSSSSTPAQAATPSPSPEGQAPTFSDNWAIGIAIGGVAVAVLMFLGMFLLEHRKRRTNLTQPKQTGRATAAEHTEKHQHTKGQEPGSARAAREITSRSGGNSSRGWDDLPEFRA